MRGPSYKLALDVRRLWRCPACGYERRVNGRITALRCQCASNSFMQLAGEPTFHRLQNRPLDPYVRAEDVLGPEDDAASPATPESAPPVPDVADDGPSSQLTEASHEPGATDDVRTPAESTAATVDAAVGPAADEPEAASETSSASPQSVQQDSASKDTVQNNTAQNDSEQKVTEGRDRRRRRKRGRRDSRPPQDKPSE
ncbi:MAG: hypothetical protein ACK5Q5_13070 [Planctomycetaceae bacterium]